MNSTNIDKVFNHYRTLLADKHNAKRNKLNKVVTLLLIKDKKTHLNTVVKESLVFYDSKEYLKRFYCRKESKMKIPKFAVYYKDYLKYFCKAMIKDLTANKVLMKNMEKIAQDFYYNNYQKGKQAKDWDNHNNNIGHGNKKGAKHYSPRNGAANKNNKFFDKQVVNEIEKVKLSNHKLNVLKKSVSNHNMSSISRILPLASKTNNNIESNDSLMESILLSLETKQRTHIPKANTTCSSNTNNNNKPNALANRPLSTLNDNIKQHKTSFPSQLYKTKSSLKITNNITAINPSASPKNIPNSNSTTNSVANLFHSTQFKYTVTKLRYSSNSNTTTNSKTFHSSQPHHPFTPVVYQYQKYRYNSSDKTPVPPSLFASPNTITIASPKHLLSVSPPSSHQKIWSPHAHNKNKTSYQRFMLQNKNNHSKRMVTSSTITNTLMHASPTGLKIKSKTKMNFNHSKCTYTKMKSFSLRNSIGIEENLNAGAVVPNNYRKANKGGYLYGSVTSLYKRDYKTVVKGENVKTNRHDASKTYNSTLRMNYNGGGKFSN